MTAATPPRQGRAPGLYDEQLQRKLQERAVDRSQQGDAREALEREARQ